MAKNKILTYTTTWVHVGNSRLSEISQTQKHCMITHTPRIHKFIETECQMKVTRGWREGSNCEPLLNGYRDSTRNNEKVW